MFAFENGALRTVISATANYRTASGRRVWRVLPTIRSNSQSVVWNFERFIQTKKLLTTLILGRKLKVKTIFREVLGGCREFLEITGGLGKVSLDASLRPNGPKLP